MLKNNDPERIRDAIRTVHHGHHVLQDVVLDKLTAGLLAEKEKSTAKPAAEGANIDKSLFTARELEIMSLIAKGLSNKEILKQAFLSEGTVANHITSILSKTGLEHRTQIAIYYLTGSIPAEIAPKTHLYPVGPLVPAGKKIGADLALFIVSAS